MLRGIFITGTDTGVGKTVVSAGLVQLAARRGQQVVGLKPVATGAIPTPDGLRNEDALALAAAGSVQLPYELTNPYCFEPAIAPHLAAADAQVPVALADLRAWYERTTGKASLAIVEGAGGWRVPLHPEGFLSDLPEQLGLDVILVVGLRLGCLNHARLTVEAINRSGRCRLLGWVGNQVDPGFARVEDNLTALSRLLGAPPLATLPWFESPDPVGAAASALARPAVLAALGSPSPPEA